MYSLSLYIHHMPRERRCLQHSGAHQSHLPAEFLSNRRPRRRGNWHEKGSDRLPPLPHVSHYGPSTVLGQVARSPRLCTALFIGYRALSVLCIVYSREVKGLGYTNRGKRYNYSMISGDSARDQAREFYGQQTADFDKFIVLGLGGPRLPRSLLCGRRTARDHRCRRYHRGRGRGLRTLRAAGRPP